MLLLLLFLHSHEPASDYHMAPAEAVALPYDATRLAPWAADQSSRSAGMIVPEDFPAPDAADYTSVAQNTFSDPSVDDLKRENAELRKRIETLEQMMKDNLSQPPIPGTQSKEAKTNKKSVPGWMVELHPWRKDGQLAKDALRTLLLQNCTFNGGLGLESEDNMKMYRFLGNFRVKEPGRYVFAFDMTCGFEHACKLNFSVDGEPVINFDGNTNGDRVTNGLPLVAGDHQLEFVTRLKSSSYIKYEPAEKFKWHPLVKGPSDLNPREFADDELFTVIPRKAHMAARPCG